MAWKRPILQPARGFEGFPPSMPDVSGYEGFFPDETGYYGSPSNPSFMGPPVNPPPEAPLTPEERAERELRLGEQLLGPIEPVPAPRGRGRFGEYYLPKLTGQIQQPVYQETLADTQEKGREWALGRAPREDWEVALETVAGAASSPYFEALGGSLSPSLGKAMRAAGEVGPFSERLGFAAGRRARPRASQMPPESVTPYQRAVSEAEGIRPIEAKLAGMRRELEKQAEYPPYIGELGEASIGGPGTVQSGLSARLSRGMFEGATEGEFGLPQSRMERQLAKGLAAGDVGEAVVTPRLSRKPLWADIEGVPPERAQLGPPAEPPRRPPAEWGPGARQPGGPERMTPLPPRDPLAATREALAPEQNTAWQQVVDAKDAMVRALLDRNAPLMQLEKQTGIPVHQLAQVVPGMRAKGEDIIRRFVEPVLAPLDKDLKHLEEYMVLRRAEDVLARNPHASLPGGIRGWPEQIRALGQLRAQVGEARFAAIESAANNLWAINERYILKPLARAGILSKEQFNAIGNAHPHYIDWHRLDAALDAVPQAGKPVASLSATGIDRMLLSGSERKLDQPLARTLAQIISVQERVARNQAAYSIVLALKKAGETVVEHTGLPITGKGTLSFFDDGRKVMVDVPKVYADVAKGLEAESAGFVGKLFMALAQPLRTGATTYNPAFVIINPIRDFISASFVGGWKTTLHPDYIKGWVAAFTKNTDFADAAEAGTFMSGIIDSFRSTKDLTRIAGRRAMGIPLDNVGDLAAFVPRLIKEMNTASERATRIAAFKAVRREGGTGLQAAIAGRNVTVDFAKSGNVVKVINQAIPFLNAGIQGAANTLRVMKNPKLAAMRAAPLAAGSALLYAWNQRFETADLVPDYEYANNWVIIIGEGTKEPDVKTGEQERYPVYLKVPKGPTGALLTAPAEMSLRLAFGKGDRSIVGDMIEAAQTAGEALSPVSLSPASLVFPAASTAFEVASNKNLFTGRDIVPQREQKRLPEEQYGPETGKAAIALGQQFGVSPRLVDYAIKDFTAGAGQAGSWLLDVALGALGYNPEAPGQAFAQPRTGTEQISRVPVVSRFMGVRNTEKERREWDAWDEAVEKSKRRLGLSPELRRLGMTPGEMGESMSIEGQAIYFTLPERTKMQGLLPKKAAPLLGRVTGADGYAKMGDARKKAAIEKAMELARDQARQEVLKTIGRDELKRRIRLAATQQQPPYRLSASGAR